MEKVALDQAAKSYWDAYFGDYGKSWTKDIPRRIKQAVRRAMKAKEVDGHIAPIASKVDDDGNLHLEAAFGGKIDGQDAKILITAAFDQKGHLTEITPNRVS